MTKPKTAVEEMLERKTRNWVKKRVRNNTLYGLLTLLTAVACLVLAIVLHRDGPLEVTPGVSILFGVIMFLTIWSIITLLFNRVARLSADYARERIRIIDHHINTLNCRMNEASDKGQKVLLESQLMLAKHLEGSLKNEVIELNTSKNTRSGGGLACHFPNDDDHSCGFEDPYLEESTA